MKRAHTFFAVILSCFFTASAATAADFVKPFVLAYTSSESMDSVEQQVKQQLKAADFDIVGRYDPYGNATIIAVTNADLKQAAGSSDMGGYAAAQRVTLTQVNDTVEVAWTNPVYYGNAYRTEDPAALASAKAALEAALGNEVEYGTGDEELTIKDLRKYHYMFGMEYFDDPSELVEYTSYGSAIAAVEEGLANARSGATKVYRIDIPGKSQTVFGVALSGPEGNECSGDEYIMSKIDKDQPRSTGHLPYEILVHEDGTVYALYARFRIAISWPHLPMIANKTGATFFNIMCAPNAIEEALIEAAGGEL